MALSKSSRYALFAAVEMARAGDRPVTVAEVAQLYGMPPTALAKVFQQLARAGIVEGTRGASGGYRLARPREAITVLDIVTVFDPVREPGHDLLHTRTRATSSSRPVAAPLRRLFDEVDEGVRATLASVSLDTLVK